MNQLYGLALSAGIGGLELGVRLALGPERYRTVCYVEWESYAASVIVARMAAQEMDDAPIWDNVKTFDGRPWCGVVDFLTAGYPCQPFSDAGLKRGTTDPRHLFPHIARIVGECAPTLCFFENVGAHLRLGFREVKSDLESLHYHVEAGLFSAEQVGAPHERERLFILAVAERAGRGEMALSPQGEQSERQANQLERRSVELGNAECRNDHWRDESESGAARQEILQSSDRTRSANRALNGSATLENFAGNGRCGRDNGTARERERASEITRYSGELAISKCGGQQGESISTDAGRGISELELADSTRAQIRFADADGNGRDKGKVGKSKFDFPTFPPRPDEYDEWQSVLARFPFVAPALQKASEPDVYRMADGTAVGVDESRYKDQLAVVGNAVSPIVAAFALCVLAKRAGVERELIAPLFLQTEN